MKDTFQDKARKTYYKNPKTNLAHHTAIKVADKTTMNMNERVLWIINTTIYIALIIITLWGIFNLVKWIIGLF